MQVVDGWLDEMTFATFTRTMSEILFFSEAERNFLLPHINKAAQKFYLDIGLSENEYKLLNWVRMCLDTREMLYMESVAEYCN